MLTQRELAALVAWETSPEFSDRERAALRFTTAVVRDDREVSDADWEQLRAHSTEPEVVELVFAFGYQTFASKFAKAFRLVHQGFSACAGLLSGRPAPDGRFRRVA